MRFTSSINILLSIICLLLLTTACSKRHLIGVWRVESKGKHENAEFHFKRNSTLNYKKPDNSLTIKSWDFSRKEQEITISSRNTDKVEKYELTYLGPILANIKDQEDNYLLVRQLKVKSINYSKALRKLRGEWALIQLEDQDVSNRLQLIFWENGAAQQISNGEVQNGRWVLSDDTKQLIFSSHGEDITFNIQFLQKKKIELEDQYGTYLFEKKKKTKKTPASWKIKSRIVGAWQLNKVGKDAVEIDYRMYLLEDGSMKIFENQEIAQVGQWQVAENGGLLILDYADQQKTYPIESMKRNKLKIRDESQTVTFKRFVE